MFWHPVQAKRDYTRCDLRFALFASDVRYQVKMNEPLSASHKEIAVMHFSFALKMHFFPTQKFVIVGSFYPESNVISTLT